MPNDSRLLLPEIVEAYRDYDPPCDVKGIISLLLRHVPRENLVGLTTILLTNREALSRDRRRKKTWSRNHKIRVADALGLYCGATTRAGATIHLHVDNILRSYPKSFLWFKPMLNVCFSDVLYHELGHHVHATRRPEYRGKEDVADTWKRKFNREFISARYWYLFPVAVVAKLIVFVVGDIRAVVRKFRNSPGPS